MDHVAMIARDTPFGRHLAQRMVQAFARLSQPTQLSALVVITPNDQARAQKVSRAARVMSRLGGGRIRRMFSAHHRQAYQLWQLQQSATNLFHTTAGPVPEWPAGVDRLNVAEAEVNAVATVHWLEQHQPRLMAVAGAPILRADLLSVPRAGTLNMHSALLPRYRGTRAEFWQVHNDDLDCAGITIHYVDTSVDGGDIVARLPQNPAAGSSPWAMRAQNQLNGLQFYPETVCAVLQGTATRAAQSGTSERAYRFSDITPDATRRVLETLRRT